MANNFANNVSYGVDHVDNPGMPLQELEKLLTDIRTQPDWRWVADVEADYYDGNQLTAAQIAEGAERGIPPIYANLIRPAVDVVLGMEAKTRTDWRVIGETDEQVDFAEALTVKLKEAERVSQVDRAVSDAFASQVKVGLGWVEVAREHNPFKPPYRVNFVHRREIWWDWRAKQADLSDARYMVRRQWLDEDQLIVMFPKYEDLIKHTISGWNTWDASLLEHSTNLADDSLLLREWGIERDTTIEEQEWRDSERRRLVLYEVWYKVWERGVVMVLADGRAMEYDEDNPRHVEAVALGLVDLKTAVFSKMRLSWWIGPHRLYDVPTPYPHNEFPYVPFFGYREDRTGVPYGLIRSMKSSQDEFNARRQKMMWLLTAKRVIVDDDAIADDDHEAVMLEVGRPDAYIRLNPDRKNPDAIKVDTDFGLARHQFEVMLDAKQNIQDASGIYKTMMGKAESGVGAPQSGIAINSLIEQGTTTLTEIYDNYRMARRHVGNLLLALVKEDLGDKEEVVRVGSDTDRQRDVVLNQMTTNEMGIKYRNNDVQRLKAEVVLEDVPSTASYRAQQAYLMTELAKSMPPELQALVLDMIVEAMDVPRRKEIADRIRRATGVTRTSDLESMTEQERAEYEAEQKAKAEQAEIAKRDALSKIAERDARAQKTIAETEPPDRKYDLMSEAKKRELVLKAQIDEEADKRRTELELEKIRLQGEVEALLQRLKDGAALGRELAKGMVQHREDNNERREDQRSGDKA